MTLFWETLIYSIPHFRGNGFTEIVIIFTVRCDEDHHRTQMVKQMSAQGSWPTLIPSRRPYTSQKLFTGQDRRTKERWDLSSIKDRLQWATWPVRALSKTRYLAGALKNGWASLRAVRQAEEHDDEEAEENSLAGMESLMMLYVYFFVSTKNI